MLILPPEFGQGQVLGCRIPDFLPLSPVWDALATLVPVGYSVLPLTGSIFRELAARSGGMRVDGLTMQVSQRAVGWHADGTYR